MTKKPTGRPSSYTEEMAATICERLSTAEGGLEEVCKADDMPHPSTVNRWLADERYAAFRAMYARARENLGDYMAHKGISEALAAKDAQLGRLHFDARKWGSARLNGKRWGDKMALTGGDETDAPVKFERIERVIRDPSTSSID